MNKRIRTTAVICATVAALAFAGASFGQDKSNNQRLVKVKMFAPKQNDHAGINGAGWFVDLAIELKVPLAKSGFTLNADNQPGFQLTGPNAPATAHYAAGVHNNVRPFPGVFSPGKDDRFPGLIVLISTSTVGAGPCQNLANLFNVLGVTNLSAENTEIWDTWIKGGPNFGVNTESAISVAVADDLNRDGIFNDAPNAVPDADGNGPRKLFHNKKSKTHLQLQTLLLNPPYSVSILFLILAKNHSCSSRAN